MADMTVSLGAGALEVPDELEQAFSALLEAAEGAGQLSCSFPGPGR